MPNYKITDAARKTIRERAIGFADRTLDYACADFPLTTATVQNIVLDEERVSDLRRLSKSGIKTIELHNNVRLAFLKEILPGVTRGLVVALWLPERIFVERATHYGISTTKFNLDEGHYIVPELSRLDPAERESLAKWVNRVVRTKRLKEIAHFTVHKLLHEDYTPTTSHLHALWPTLTQYAKGAEVQGAGLRRNPTTGVREWHDATSWQDRMRNPTRSLKRYQPAPHIRERYRKLIAASDTVLVQGELLAPWKYTSGLIRATAEHHETLPTDLNLNLIS